MTLIKLEDLKRWRAKRVQSGNCSFDDMQALAVFIAESEVGGCVECGDCYYFENGLCSMTSCSGYKAEDYCSLGERRSE